MQKLFLFLLFPAFLAFLGIHVNEKYTIEGVVVDQSSGEPLIGVTVQVKGTRNGTVTDMNGEFKLETQNKCEIIVFQYTGFQTVEKKGCDGEKMTVELIPGVELSEEVVITGSVQQAKKSSADKRKRTSGRKNRIADYAPLHAPETYEAQPAVGYYDDRTIHNTEDYATITENRFFEVTKEPLSTFSIDVDAASYSNMRRFVNNGQKPPKDAIRIEEMVNYFEYEYPEPKGEHPFEIITELSDCPWQPKHQLLHIGLQGKRIAAENLPASNLVFLLDVSGSMDAPNKLPLLQSSLKLLTDQLREQDKVSIVVYAGAAGTVLQPTSGSNKIKIKDAIDRLRAGGSTAGSAGIKLAYQKARENFVKGGNNRVILATDGDFNVGISSDAELVRLIEKERESGVFLTILGFGTGNYKDNKMQELADKGNGNHAYIDNIQEARKVLVSEFGGTVFTIAKDVKIQIEFNPMQVNGYRLIGYENRVLAAEDFNDDRKDAGELGAGHTVTALYEIIPAGVESEFLAKVDDLKYQQTTIDKKAARNKELVTVKFRYKKPDGDKSRLIEKVVMANAGSFEQASENYRWSAAVAELGMLLRESKYISEGNFQQALKLARAAKGKDEHGYRQEFIRMMEAMQSLVKPDLAGK